MSAVILTPAESRIVLLRSAAGYRIVRPSGYVLPVASAGTLGGVKVGSGLSVAGDGTLSAAVSAATISDSTAVGRSLLTAADAAAARSAIGAGTGNALTSGTLAQFAATTSAELAGVLTDETGTGGGFVRATGPTLNGTVTINTGSVGTVGLNVDAVASQTAAPARVRDSAGNVVFQIVPSSGTSAANAPWLMVIGNAVGARSLAFDTSEGAIAVRDAAGNSLTNFVAATVRGRSGVAADTFVSVGNIELSAAGWRGDRVGLGNATQVIWSSSTSGTGTAVLGIARLDDNTVEINNGTRTASGGALRGLRASNLTLTGLTTLGTYTVATLPSASANAGAFAQVTDSNSTTNGGIVAGGGANRVPVFSNGTNWIIK